MSAKRRHLVVVVGGGTGIVVRLPHDRGQPIGRRKTVITGLGDRVLAIASPAFVVLQSLGGL